MARRCDCEEEEEEEEEAGEKERSVLKATAVPWKEESTAPSPHRFFQSGSVKWIYGLVSF